MIKILFVCHGKTCGYVHSEHTRRVVGFNTFSIYQVLPQLIELWGLNVQTDVEAKKNFVRQTVK